MKKKIMMAFIVTLVVLAILPAAYFTYCNITYKGKKDSTKILYLKTHKFIINDKNIVIPVVFGKKIETGKNHVFIFGEQHGFAPNCQLSSKILIYLNKNRDVRTYGAEITTENAEKLNRIINADRLDEKALSDVIHNIGKDIPQRQSDDYMKEWNEIYAYNRSVNGDHKIHVLGLLGKDYEHSKLLRDQVMAKSLMNFMEDPANSRLVKNGCYCFVGYTHAFQTPYRSESLEIQTFGSILKKNKFCVTSMVEIALNSDCFLPKNDQIAITTPDEKTKLSNCNGPLYYCNNVINLEKASDGVVTAIYALDGDGSPYRDCNDFVNITVSLSLFSHSIQGLPSYSTLDYFQYVFMINGHQAPKSINS